MKRISFRSDVPCVVVRPTGTLSPAMVRDLLDELLAASEFRRGISSIWDLSEADLSELDAAKLKAIGQLSEERADRRGPSRVAMVLPKDFSYGLGRQYEVLGEVAHLHRRFFREFDAALAWIREGQGTGP